jgi:hypothetical protein
MQLRFAAPALWPLLLVACSGEPGEPGEPSDPPGTSDPTAAGSTNGGRELGELLDGSSGAVSVVSTDGSSEVSETENARDASLDAAADAMTEAGQGEHLCYVYDDCNGGRNNDYSARACPETPPRPGAPCNLPAGSVCFYCAPGEDALHWYPPVPVHDCKNGAWALSLRHYACE